MEIIFYFFLFILSFLTTAIFIKYWIIVAKKNKLTGRDMNKNSKNEVAESGGIGVIFGIIFAIQLYIFFEKFIIGIQDSLIECLTILSCILMAGLLGFIDDTLGWKRGLKQWQKPLLTIPVAVPLMVINAGVSSVSIPFFGAVDFGIFFPLLIIPLAVIFSANSFNMLAGYNGLEAGMGVIILSTLGLVAYISGVIWLAVLIFSSVFSLIAFLFSNWYPARVFPGNSFTYAIGSLIAIFAILGDMEKVALILLIPYLITFFLKSRSRFRAESFARVNRDGSLSVPYKKFYDVTHLSLFALSKIKKKVYEKDVVIFILFIEILIALFALLTL